MKERPILFSGSMVRAILEGRKTQTRRVVRGSIGYLGGSGGEADLSSWGWFFDGPDHHGYMVLARGMNQRHDHGCISIPCPYGEPGDRLWVRETWALVQWLKDWETGITDDVRDWTKPIPKTAPGGGWSPVHQATYGGDAMDTVEERGFRWRPSIHMPRWASRLTLEVTEVCVQRLQNISEEDARAEGVEAAPFCKAGRPNGMEHVEAFEDLWTAINGERPGCSWADNPWVWCVSFRRAS